MEFKIMDHTIFLTIHGSHAYGMSIPESDVDIKGIAIPPKEYLLGVSKNFEQFEGQLPRETISEVIEGAINRKLPNDELLDSVVYSIKKFFQLASQCNPNIIEILFTDERFHIYTSDIFEKIKENRDLFVSSRAKFRFCGYAFSQLKRIKTHRSWLLNPPKKKPERADFGLLETTMVPKDQREAAESLIKKQVEKWILLEEELPREVLESVRNKTIENIVEIWESLSALSQCSMYPISDGQYDMNILANAAGTRLGYDSNFLQLLDAERQYRGAMRYYQQYQQWKANRNPIRAEMEAKYGYDLKHASHLVRLFRMAEEILTEGKVIVFRPDAEELLAIRNGSWTFDDLMEWADNQQKKLDEFYESGKSPLPKKPDMKKIDQLCIDIIEKNI